MELKGKKIAFLGDSITEGVGVVDRVNNRYDNVMKREYALAETFNYGIGGTRLAHQIKASQKPRHDLCFCGRAYDISKEADVIVVYGGINDYLHGDAPFGEMGDTTPETFSGGVRFLMEFLVTEYPGKKVVFLTPARLCYKDGIDGSAPSHHPNKRLVGRPLADYISIIKETAKIFDIPVFDMYENLGIDPTIPEEKGKYTCDGLHFNDLGHSVIAKRVADFLCSL